MYRAIGLVGASNVIGPLIIFAATPVLTRLYTPAQLGEFFFLIAAAPLLALCLSGQLFNAIHSARYLTLAKRIYTEVVYVVLISGAVVITLTALLFLSGLLGDQTLISLTDVVAVIAYAILIALTQARKHMLTREARLRTYVSCVTVRALVIASAQVTLPFFFGYASISMLFFAAFVGELGLLIVAGFFNLNELRIRHNKPIWNRFYARRYLKLTTYYMPSLLFGLIANTTPQLVLKLIGNVALLGMFGLLLRVIQTPLAALAQGVRATYWISVRESKSLQYTASMRNSLVVLLVGIFASAVYLASGGRFIEIFAGSQWLGIDWYVPFVLMWFTTSLANSFPLEVLKHTGRLRLVFWADILSGILKISATCAAAVLESDIVVWFAISAVLCNVITLMFYLSRLRADRVPTTISTQSLDDASDRAALD